MCTALLPTFATSRPQGKWDEINWSGKKGWAGRVYSSGECEEDDSCGSSADALLVRDKGSAFEENTND